MTTNPAPKKPAAAKEESADILTETPTDVATHTAPAASPTAGKVTVTLAHHHTLDGASYPPGAQIQVTPDTAHSLRMQGYATHG
ncbi:hypothetical protein ACFQ6U_13655 [Streptomyces sp. NPDC056465]|uniref:DUF7210 family protein n=1 Tax=Streptomyces sp. NPDC056465 TaxID=3345829 RepID=UPI0036B94E08